MKAYLPGIYPRSEELVQATRDLDRARTTEDAVEAQVRRDERQLASAQEEAGLDLFSDGMLRWQDHFRRLAENSDGLEARPLTRFLDTNTFYRAVLVEGDPLLVTGLPAPDFPEGRWLGTLPSPPAFSRAANGEATAQALAAGVLAPQIEAWARSGAALIVLSDPFLLTDPSLLERGVDDLSAALEELPAEVSYVLQLPFGDASSRLERLAELPVEAIGIDFYSTPLEAVPEDYPKEIAAGVIDARSSALEDPSEVANFVERLAQRNPAGISLIPNGDLQFVPERIAREKVSLLGRARAVVKEEVAAS